MSDKYFNNENNEYFDNDESGRSDNNENTRDIYDDFSRPEESTEESSYEWNSDRSYRNGEYHYSYINGNNSGADHNPNNYDDAFSTTGSQDSYAGERNDDSANPYSSSYTGQQDSTRVYSYGTEPAPKKKKEKRKSKGASRGFVAAALAIAVLGSTAAGLGGGYLIAKSQNSAQTSSSGSLTIKQVSSDGDSENATNVASDGTTISTTSDIVKKTANSVVEIATEGVTTGTFAQQYVTKGAGSGVIISEDGYIVTNHHVIDGANKITVTLRDGTTTYDAKLIGSDADNDIALLKIEASGLSAATFGNSSDLVVGDYVVAIGNPLGTLGGTVTDGIISALAREVTIENKNLTLLQTNAQISPGNSGGGLFNAKGELVGIVNAKDSATEVEGIAFAIPVNNVVGIIKDLKDYGYVTGKISTGMEFVDINSYDSAFYYNVSALGVYVLSVESGSNAEKAGFRSGDMISEVNGTSVSSSAEIDKALENCKVGDKVTFTVTRSGKQQNLTLELSEYVPTVKPNDEQEQQEFHSNDNLWKQLLDW